MTKEQEEWINKATYQQLLYKWRFTPVGDPLFQGECGEHYAGVLSRKGDEDPDRAVEISKLIGWGE